MARHAEAPLVDVLIPTCDRPEALAVTLAGLAAQTLPAFRVVVSDQSERPDLPDGAIHAPEVMTPLRLLRARGREVETFRHLPRRGLAEQRQFLLDQASARYALFLDDDVLCEPDLVERLLAVMLDQQCGFVGMPLVGLSHLDDVRPHQQAIEPWEGPVEPELITPGDDRWARHHLHSAANAWHVQEQLRLKTSSPLLYKVAWIGGCVLYDVAKLRAVGGFEFWRELPPAHCGEDVLAQLRVMAEYGGCGVLPTGAYHQQLPTTVPDRTHDAPYLLPVS
ncbi:MAG TPA: glycosyltransferase family A protein [Kineosporiaceae bacterium]|jgi:GT2 family glycosyltransferase|nr:glycosyltransferase family A protein [Kineosporiaceae bacterium]